MKFFFAFHRWGRVDAGHGSGLRTAAAAVWDPADGALCSANVPRPGPQAAQGSSLISLRKAHHRRSLSAQRLLGQHNATCPGLRSTGGSCSEIKEEPQAGDIRGRGYPLASVPRTASRKTT